MASDPEPSAPPGPALRPCPFCGTAAALGMATGAAAASPSWVVCEACDVMGPMRAGAAAARRAWNQRAQPAAEADGPRLPAG